MSADKEVILPQLKNPNYIRNKTRRRELVSEQKQLLKKVCGVLGLGLILSTLQDSMLCEINSLINSRLISLAWGDTC